MPTFSPAWKRVPRWRTMIEPALIASPPNTFTPSRFACESRPLREEPPAFLCAIFSSYPLLDHWGSLGWIADLDPSVDCVDAQFGEILPMTRVLLKMLAPAHLEDPYLVVPAVSEHGGSDRGACNQRRAHAQIGSVADGEHLGERDHATHVRTNRFNAQFVSGGDAILLAAGLYYCIHGLLRAAASTRLF